MDTKKRKPEVRAPRSWPAIEDNGTDVDETPAEFLDESTGNTDEIIRNERRTKEYQPEERKT